ncbi:MAG: hypothetical protein ACP5QU_04510 [Anaerolineae bacterium]
MSITVSRAQVIHCLREDWGKYRACFESLSVAEQAAFLQRQGYATFHDLLAHICAWWEEGLKVIHSILENEPLCEHPGGFAPWRQKQTFLQWTHILEG